MPSEEKVTYFTELKVGNERGTFFGLHNLTCVSAPKHEKTWLVLQPGCDLLADAH